MIKDLDYTNRQLLPRWVPFNRICALHPQENSSRPLNAIELTNYKNSLTNWEKNRTIPFALELITSSHVFELTDTYEYKTAVDFILEKHADILNKNPFLELFLGKDNINSQTESNIHHIKHQIATNCKNSSLWIDLAYYYEILGQKEKSNKAIQTALYLHPKNIFLLRAIAKFYLLRKEIDKALFLLNDDTVKNNPLIISAEIAISEAYGEKSKLLRRGISYAKSGVISTPYENELFSTIGTLEFNSGNSKKGKKLFSQALVFPNENIIAQARYISSKTRNYFDILKYDVPNRHEADAWFAYDAKNFSKVLEMSEKWFYFQPFSTTPAIMNSYINSLVFQDEKKSIDMAKRALRISPDSFSLQNNLVVALFRDNKVLEGNEQFEKLKKMENLKIDDKDVFLATSGLVDYRNGKKEIGRIKYKEAIDTFEKSRNFEKKARCLYYWACEAKNANESDFLLLAKNSKELADKYNFSDIQVALARNFKL